MRKSTQFMLAAGFLGFMLSTSIYAQEAAKPAEPDGKDLAFNNKKGNCLACHLMPGVPGAVTNATIGPPLVAMKARFPDKVKLRDQVWDATKANPASSMPPFGKHQILSDKEIDKIVDFIYGI
jgi:sulfur-oxidizing protein SoxX